MNHLRHQKCKNKLEKPINVSIRDMDKFEKKKIIKKRAFTKNTWYGWHSRLINYIPEPIKETVDGFKDQIMGHFKAKDYSKPESVKAVYGGGKKHSEENIIKSIRNLFKLEK